MGMSLRVGLDRLVKIQRPVVAKDAASGATRSWQLVASVWAEVVDALPSKAESVVAGVQRNVQGARVRIRWRDDIDASMRIVDERGRTLQIVAGPAELGRRQYLELYCEAFSTTGTA